MSNDTPRDWEELKKRMQEGRSGFESPYVEDVGGAWFDAGLTYETVLELIAEVERLTAVLFETEENAENSHLDAEHLKGQRDAVQDQLAQRTEHVERVEESLAEALCENVSLNEQLSQLKAERDRMAEASISSMTAAQEALDKRDNTAAYNILWAAIRRARSALNTGEKTDG